MNLIMYYIFYEDKEKSVKKKITPEAFRMNPSGLRAGMISAFNLKYLKKVF